MQFIRYILCFLFFIFTLGCSEKNNYALSVKTKAELKESVPIAVDSSQINALKQPTSFVLNEDSYTIPFQFDSITGKYWFIYKPGSTYEIVEGNPVQASNGLSLSKDKGNLKLSIKGKHRLSYKYGMTPAPKGVSKLFQKSGYLHPVLSPAGDTLTRIQPPDHYHHYGIWGPWTHTKIDTVSVDFWNLGEGQGTVLFQAFKTMQPGAVYSVFQAKQNHINLKKENGEVAIRENLEVRLWDLGVNDRYMIDYTSAFKTPLLSGILLEAYRYGGGLGMRFTERWYKDNSEVLTSEGKSREEADGTSARWCIVSGDASTGNGKNGILFMSHPNNRSHPEPMRVWPKDANNGRGDLFFEFCPIRHLEWKLQPNKTYQLKYRMVVFEGKLSAQEAEAYWQAFAYPPKVTMTLMN